MSERVIKQLTRTVVSLLLVKDISFMSTIGMGHEPTWTQIKIYPCRTVKQGPIYVYAIRIPVIFKVLSSEKGTTLCV